MEDPPRNSTPGDDFFEGQNFSSPRCAFFRVMRCTYHSNSSILFPLKIERFSSIYPFSAWRTTLSRCPDAKARRVVFVSGLFVKLSAHARPSAAHQDRARPWALASMSERRQRRETLCWWTQLSFMTILGEVWVWGLTFNVSR